MPEEQKDEKRADYLHFRTITTRWMDNDVYGHVNNVQYYSYFDTVVNGFLIDQGVLDFENDEIVGLVVETHCKFYASAAFPDAIEAGIRVAHLGRSSVRYEIGLFVAGRETPIAAGHFVHVYVRRGEQRPVPIPDAARAVLAGLMRRQDQG